MQTTYQLDYMPTPAQTPDDAPPVGIVMHHWGVFGQTHEGVARYLSRSGANTSAHYVVSEGKVTCLVDPLDTAWHAGTWPSNVANIGIEARPEMSPGDFETAAELIAWLRAQFGPLPLTGHKDHFATTCPGQWYDQLERLSARANEILSGSPVNPQPTEMETPEMATIIETTTPWGETAYARLHPFLGAEALTGQDAASAIKTNGVSTLPWDWWNHEIGRAWRDHDAFNRLLGRVMTESVEAATARVVAAATGKQAQA